MKRIAVANQLQYGWGRRLQFNEQIGLQRARSVAELIKKAGIQVNDLTIASHGERNLLVATPDNTSEPKNRRVEITVR